MGVIKTGFVLLIGLLAVMYGVVYIGPELVRDFGVRGPLVPASDVRIDEAKCTTHWFVVTTCSVSYTRPQQASKTSLSYFFLGGMPQPTVQLMSSARDRNVVVTDIGMAKLYNRAAALVLFLTLLAIGGYGFTRRMATA